MKNLRNTKTYDFDDYFMQKISAVDLNGDTLRIQVEDRADLIFNKVKIDFVALKFFNQSEQDKTLYSMYVNKKDNLIKVDLKILCEDEIGDVIFTAQQIIC